jgi:Peptidase family M28
MGIASAGSLQQPKAPEPAKWPSLLAVCFICLLATLAIWQLRPPAAVPASAAQNEFSAERALTHVRAIAESPHPIGSRANAAARDYLLGQMSALGMNPQVTTAVGINDRSAVIVAANTRDVVGRLPGTESSGAIMLTAHYDSVPSGPGAADDAAAVAAILETIRALKAEASLKNDLIVLLTDGEEVGLLGAEAFAASHPWMKDVGLILNFEARGNSGPSLLFETTAKNASLMNEVAHAAPYPIGSSLFYALYKLLPNDTDLTVFRPTGTPGLNFAFGGSLEAYHSSLDTPDHLDTASLQHHGSYALALVRHFGRMDLKKFKQAAGDDVFFDWLGSRLIAYSEGWVIIAEVIVTILLLLSIVLYGRRAGDRKGALIGAFFACLGVLLIIPISMAGVGWLLLRFLGEHLLLGDTPANAWLLVGLAVLGSVTGCAALGKFRKRLGLEELSLAGLLVVCILSWTAALLLPAGSYLLFWPLLFSTVGLLALRLFKKESPTAMAAATLAGATIAVLLFAPVAYLLYVFLTLNLLSIAAIGVLMGSFFILCVPVIDIVAPQGSARFVLLPMLASAGLCLGMGITQSHTSAGHPRRDTLLYSLNADDHTAVWISYDNALDGYTSQFISGKAPARRAMPDYLAGSQLPVLSRAAPILDLQPPVAEIKADQKDGDVHNLRMTVRSQRDAGFMVVRFDPSVKPLAVKIAGRTIALRKGGGRLSLVLYAMGPEGADLDLTLAAPSGISFQLGDYSAGLPTALRRSPELVAAQNSDQTLVGRKYILAPRAR